MNKVEEITYYKVEDYLFDNEEKANQYCNLINEYKFDKDQKEIIKNGLDLNLDISIYANPEFYYRQMEEIRLGLEKGLDVSWYAKPEFNYP